MSEFTPGEGNVEFEKGTDLPHHYHAHDKDCNDMDYCLHRNEHDGEENEHSEKHGSKDEVMEADVNEHTEPGEIKDRDEVGKAGKGEYPGFIRKMR